MNRLNFVHARVSLEAVSPVIVSTSGGTDASDASCIVDCNGAPMLPGTSLAGLLRAETLRRQGPVVTARLFGFQEEALGARSRVVVGHGYAHGEDGTPSPGRLLAKTPDFLARLGVGVLRDHVRLNGRGVADGSGKFDERLAPTGTRWTFAVTLYAEGDEEQTALTSELDQLLAALMAGRLTVGGRGRRGFGKVKLIRAVRRTFALTNEDDRVAWASVRGNNEPEGWIRIASVNSEEEGDTELTVNLSPEGPWMFGRGEEELLPSTGPSRSAVTVQMTPVREPRVMWEEGSGKGTFTEPAYIAPATGIKGALQHRSLFHARRLAGAFVGAAPANELRAIDAIRALFGDAKRRGARGRNSGTAGWLRISEGELNPSGLVRAPFAHLSNDRFTGGPLDGHLFHEAPLFGGRLSFRVSVPQFVRVSHRASFALGLRAFAAALRDLYTGRLALGGGSGRGLGTFSAGEGMKRTLEALEERAQRLQEEGDS